MKVSFVAFVLAFLAFLGLAFYYLETLKPVPDASTGAIHPLNNHGWVVYLNGQQHAWLMALQSAALACAVVAVAIKLLVLRGDS
jgi:putative exporter of polyketide antibiotics